MFEHWGLDVEHRRTRARPTRSPACPGHQGDSPLGWPINPLGRRVLPAPSRSLQPTLTSSASALPSWADSPQIAAVHEIRTGARIACRSTTKSSVPIFSMWVLVLWHAVSGHPGASCGGAPPGGVGFVLVSIQGSCRPPGSDRECGRRLEEKGCRPATSGPGSTRYGSTARTSAACRAVLMAGWLAGIWADMQAPQQR